MFSDRKLALLAQEAYTKEPSLSVGDVHSVFTRETGEGGELVIAFRGTTRDPIDWLRDLTIAFGHTDPVFGLIHEGFVQGALGVYTLAKDQLAHEARIVLTGHSLGGALALAFAAFMVRNKGANPRVVTFGAPRVGGKVFCSFLKDLDIRQYRDGNDPVVDVPFWPMIHPRDLTMVGQPLDFARRIECHFMVNYLAALPPDQDSVAAA